jgi:Zn-dependent M28 family amino/carboxypeptidase
MSDQLGATSNSAIKMVNVKNIHDTVIHLQSYGDRFTREKQWEASRWIKAEFEKSGLENRLQTYVFKDKTWPNVIAEIKGNKKPDQIIMAIAHTDTTADNPQRMAPGADDNGSGVAVILEIARILWKFPLERTVVFCIFTNEERGAAGSKHYAQEARNHDADINAVINLDILGYNRPEKLFYLSAVMAHHTLKHKVKAVYRMGRNFFTGLITGGDYVKVVGREQNGPLVKTVSQVFRNYSNLKVKEVIDDDCG